MLANSSVTMGDAFSALPSLNNSTTWVTTTTTASAVPTTTASAVQTTASAVTTTASAAISTTTIALSTTALSTTATAVATIVTSSIVGGLSDDDQTPITDSLVYNNLSWITELCNKNCVQKINKNCTTNIFKFVKLINWYDNNLANNFYWKQEHPNISCKNILENFTKYDKLQRLEERKKGKTIMITTVPGYKNPSTKRSYLQSLLSLFDNEDRMDNASSHNWLEYKVPGCFVNCTAAPFMDKTSF